MIPIPSVEEKVAIARTEKTLFINKKGLSALRKKSKGERYVGVNIASPYSICSIW